MNFENLKSDNGADNMGGTRLIAYMALWEDIATFPAYKTSPTSMAEENLVEANIVLKTGKKFLEIEAEPTSGKVEDNLIEGHGNGYESTYEFLFPNNSAAALGFARIAPTSKFLVIVIDNDGQRRILGMLAPAKIISVAHTTGLASENAKGGTYQVKSYQHGPAPVYTGLIDNDSGSGSGI